jgi:hypothetical protein
MANQFTHRQDSIFSHTSICLKCFRVVATREHESELGADEAIHSCKISPPGTKPAPTYWGILCRTCAKLVAFDTLPPQSCGPGAEGSGAGTIRCAQGHSHIYFPRDFRLFPSTVAIADATMQENLKVYKSINPSWELFSDRTLKPSIPKDKNESSIHAAAPNRIEIRAASLVPDPRRETAKKVAKDRWATWALKKTLGPQ